MNTARLTSAGLIFGLLTVFAAPLAADRNDDRDGKILRKAPAAQETPRRADTPVRARPERDHRAEPPRTREPRKDTPRVVAPPKPPVVQTTPRATVRERKEPDKKVRTQPVPPTPEHRERPKPAPKVIHPPLPKPPPGYVIDKRHSHNHYYPPRGHLVPTLPAGHRVVVHRNVRYHYHDGIWYRPSGTRFIVVLPPPGIIVPFLPPFFTIIWYGAVPYYYAGGVYYLWYPEYRYYAVAEPPPESEVREQPAGSDELFVYPKQGQSEAQQAQDRYECHRWAVDQTGFDPSLPGGNVAESEYASKRSDYRRAMQACLEARGYSVQ